MPEVNIIVRAKDEASRVLGGIGRGVGGLSNALLGLGAVGGVALAGLAIGAGKLAVDAAQLEPIEISFQNLAASIDTTADELLDKLRPAVLGTLSDADLMRASNKLIAMGLADSADKAAELAEMAVTLGRAMGVDATTSLENFTLMLANQSIPRLDTFGISSGKVRQRIDELMDSVEGMTREQAFMIATMEQGEIAMGKVGDVSDTMAVHLEQVKAKFANIKDTVGTALMPLLDVFMTTVLDPLAKKIEEWAPKLTPVIEQFGYLAQAIMDPDQDWVAYLNNEVWEALENAFGTEAADKIVDFVQDGIENLQKFVDDTLIPFVEYLRSDVIPAFMEWWESEGFQGVLDTFTAIGDAITTVTGNLQELGDAIQSFLNLPGVKWFLETLAAGAEVSLGAEVPFMPGVESPFEGLLPKYTPPSPYQEPYSQQAYTPAVATINVFGVPELEQELRDIISRIERGTV